MEVEEETRGEIFTVMKHVCRLCSRRFRCGRSLGGHMKSHLITNPSSDHETVDQEKVNSTRNKKKKKTWRADNHQSNGCKQCGKTFQSSKALSGHMKSHAVKRERVKAKAATYSSPSSSTHSLASEIDQQEQEDVAIGLIMLSRDSRQWGEDDYSVEDDQFKTEFSSSCLEETLKRKMKADQGASKSVIQKHECPVCFKVFSSGQALGGHKRSHLIPPTKKKINVSADFLDLNRPAPLEEETTSSVDKNHLHLLGFKQWWVDWITN